MPAVVRALAVGTPTGFLFDYLDAPIPWMIGPMIPFALLNSFFILIASVAAGAALAWAFVLPVATMIIATSPGGLAEMTITARARADTSPGI